MAPTGPERRRALFYGDSNTYGTDPGAGRGSGGRYPASVRWPDTLAAALADRWDILTDALPGRCIPELSFEREDMARSLRRSAPLDLFAVMLGTNDYLSGSHPDAGRVGERLDRAMAWVRSECAAGLAGAEVLVIAPPYLDFGDDRFYGPYSTTDGRLSRELAQCAARAGASFLDAGAWGLPLAADGIHLSPEGHRIFAENMLRYFGSKG